MIHPMGSDKPTRPGGLQTRSSSCVVVAPGGRRQAPPWWALVAAAPFAGLYSRQISGRAAVTSRLRRAAQKAQATNLRADFERTAPNWSAGTSHLEDDLLLKAWSSSELLQFPRRGRQGTAGLDPKVCVSDLCPEHRLRVWAYLRQLNPHEPSLAAIFAAMDAVPGRQKLRVKELFESCDIVSAIVQWWLRRDRRDGRRVGTRQPERIIDAACGHGLVGMLLSHCFPDSAVCAVDREERKLMPVALSTWAQLGRRLDNFETLRCRQTVGLVEGSLSPSPSTLVVAVHACNQATLDVLDLAAHFGTSWAVVPCCMRKQKYFPGGSSHLERDEHYPVMCGALSARFGADMLHSIDRLISTKNLIIAKRAPRHGYATAAEPGNFLLASSENAHWIQDVTDPLADDFRNLKEPGPQLSREGAFFVVEGPEAIRLLLASDFAVTKLLLKPSLLDSMAEALESRLKRETSAGADAQVMLLLCEAGLMEKVTGIPAKHASAALAIARRRAPCCLQDHCHNLCAAEKSRSSRPALPFAHSRWKEVLTRNLLGLCFESQLPLVCPWCFVTRSAAIPSTGGQSGCPWDMCYVSPLFRAASMICLANWLQRMCRPLPCAMVCMIRALTLMSSPNYRAGGPASLEWMVACKSHWPSFAGPKSPSEKLCLESLWGQAFLQALC
eukprot:s254_g28.t11